MQKGSLQIFWSETKPSIIFPSTVLVYICAALYTLSFNKSMNSLYFTSVYLCRICMIYFLFSASFLMLLIVLLHLNRRTCFLYSYYFWMITWIKKVKNFQISNFSLRVFLAFAWLFANFILALHIKTACKWTLQLQPSVSAVWLCKVNFYYNFWAIHGCNTWENTKRFVIKKSDTVPRRCFSKKVFYKADFSKLHVRIVFLCK